MPSWPRRGADRAARRRGDGCPRRPGRRARHPAEPRAGSMSGKVFIQSTQAPVESATLTIRHVDTVELLVLKTDASGAFRLEPLLPGQYLLLLYKSGLTPLRLEDLRVQLGQELSVEIPVLLQASVEGKVTDALGRAVERASLFALRLDGPPGKKEGRGARRPTRMATTPSRGLDPGATGSKSGS